MTAFKKEKKMLKPFSIRLQQSTRDALNKRCYKEDRSANYIIERALRRDLKLDS